LGIISKNKCGVVALNIEIFLYTPLLLELIGLVIEKK